jgi:phosphocarrier protein HPr
MSASAEATVLITHTVGLHARPSVKFTKLAKSFTAEVEVAVATNAVATNGPWFDAKSIVKVMAAKAPKGTMLHIRAKGDGARAAVEALVDLVQRDFDEDADHARSA